jgi:hypothetical protein
VSKTLDIVIGIQIEVDDDITDADAGNYISTTEHAINVAVPGASQIEVMDWWLT